MRWRHLSTAVPASATTWKGSITVVASGSVWAAAVLYPVNPSMATISTPLRKAVVWAWIQLMKVCLDRPGTISNNRCWSGPIGHRGEVNDHGDIAVAPPGMAPDVFIDTEHANTGQAVGVINEQPSSGL